ncbi:MAG: glutamate--tRNA ligase [Syntrophomonadaceae bacterium]|nr:glutamate--tRNA ligase [Syntrophomonadaceae bacterium]
MQEVRVRFAPSPTGTLHIGGARTALFNLLFARHNQGKLILRLEDTDMERSTHESAQGIIEGLNWLGILWDEGPDIGGSYGPYRQSERLSMYQQYARQLLDNGHAYYCYCSPKDIALEREKAQNNKINYRHNCPYKHKKSAAIDAVIDGNPVLRFNMPADGVVVINDLVRGSVEFRNDLLDDIIILKSDGWPTYNFAVVVDDHCMNITHVIRAEEHLSNTPRQVHIYEALGWSLPYFAHVSMILAPDRSKLSKRHGATSVQEFRDQGYLPQALLNYLALLGWSPGDDMDILSLSQMISLFDLNNVSKSAAIYDMEKLTWMNGNYITELGIEDLFSVIEAEARSKQLLSNDNRDYFVKVISLVRSRVKTIVELFASIDYFFISPSTYDEKGAEKYFRKNDAIGKLQIVDSLLASNPFKAEQIEIAFRSKADEMGYKAADLIHPTRLALSGRTNTPGLFEIMELLGPQVCKERIESAINFLK